MKDKLPYIPLVLQYVPSVISDTNSISKVYTTYKLLISQEASSNYSIYQTLPQQYVVTIPTSGILRLKLMLLDKDRGIKNPINRYRVHYYAGNEMLDTQYWVVPNIKLNEDIITMKNNGLGDPVTLPNRLYEISSITPEVEYSIVDNLLYFDNSAPAGDYVIKYQPGLSLYDIVVSE